MCESKAPEILHKASFLRINSTQRHRKKCDVGLINIHSSRIIPITEKHYKQQSVCINSCGADLTENRRVKAKEILNVMCAREKKI